VPEIAWLGIARLNAARVALPGTLRSDGSPGSSPVEPYFAAGRLLVGVMAWSKKAADLMGHGAHVNDEARVHYVRFVTFVMLKLTFATEAWRAALLSSLQAVKPATTNANWGDL
jgi:hypothetical protein